MTGSFGYGARFNYNVDNETRPDSSPKSTKKRLEFVPSPYKLKNGFTCGIRSQKDSKINLNN